MESMWSVIEKKWPLAIGVQKITEQKTGAETTGLAVLKQTVHDFLLQNAIRPVSFSHYGFVVKNIDATCAEMDLPHRCENLSAQKAWVEAYKVHVLRFELAGTELELIEPAGNSFFEDFLKNEGEGLHHVSFQVEKIQACLDALQTNGTELVDAIPRVGSHGKVAFTKPGPIAPLYLELCEF